MRSNKRKMNLSGLKVQSFVTSMEGNSENTIKGGLTPLTPITITVSEDFTKEVSDYLGCNTENNCEGTNLNCTCKYC